jgi:hypothetical protein
MSFRWIAIISLWTWLIAPIIGAPSGSPPTRRPHVGSKAPQRVLTPRPTTRSQLHFR